MGEKELNEKIEELLEKLELLEEISKKEEPKKQEKTNDSTLDDEWEIVFKKEKGKDFSSTSSNIQQMGLLGAFNLFQDMDKAREHIFKQMPSAKALYNSKAYPLLKAIKEMFSTSESDGDD